MILSVQREFVCFSLQLGPVCSIDFLLAGLLQPQSNNMTNYWILGLFVGEYWWGGGLTMFYQPGKSNTSPKCARTMRFTNS